MIWQIVVVQRMPLQACPQESEGATGGGGEGLSIHPPFGHKSSGDDNWPRCSGLARAAEMLGRCARWTQRGVYPPSPPPPLRRALKRSIRPRTGGRPADGSTPQSSNHPRQRHPSPAEAPAGRQQSRHPTCAEDARGSPGPKLRAVSTKAWQARATAVRLLERLPVGGKGTRREVMGGVALVWDE